MSGVPRDLSLLSSLYAKDAVFESPLVWATSDDRRTGFLRGRSQIVDFFARGFDAPENGLGRWYRTGLFFSNGRKLGVSSRRAAVRAAERK